MQPLQFTEFQKLAPIQQIQLLGKINLDYCKNAPLLVRFYLDVLRNYRGMVRGSQPFLGGTEFKNLDEKIQEFYYRFRLCLTMDDIARVFDAFQEPELKLPEKQACHLTEYMEDLLRKCLTDANWTEEHQKQLVELQPEIERHQLLSFMQEVMMHVRVIGVEKVALITERVTSFLQSHPRGETFTKEQLDSLFTTFPDCK